MVVQQVVQLSAVYLVHGHSDCEVASCVLPVVDSPVKQVRYRQLLQALHRVGLARAGLAVCEYGYSASIEYQVKDGLNTALVELLIGLSFTEGVIKFKLLVFYELGDPVYLKSVLMHNHQWVHE